MAMHFGADKLKTQSVIAFLVFVVCVTCSKSNDAPERNFYFEIESHHHSTKQLASYLGNHIAYNKYTITNRSDIK